MPNHTTNRLTIDGSPEAVAAVLDAIRGTDDDGNELVIDFDRVVPMPAAIRETMRQPGEAVTQAGADDWYDWRITHWGTKWNAYWQELRDGNVIEFDTAWSPPLPLIAALAAQHPAVRFTLEFADENCGEDAGILVYERGEIVAETAFRGRGAVKFWFELNGSIPEEYGYDPITFEYVEGDEPDEGALIGLQTNP